MKLAALLLSSLCASAAFADAKTVTVELGKEFKLMKGETARIAGTKAALRITKFINSPCPKGAQCVWSGLAVIHELTVDGKPVPPAGKGAPYDIDVKGSDYKSYAVFLIEEPEAACARIKGTSSGECLRGLARREGSPDLCRKIPEERTRGFCLEDLAEELKRDDLCSGVAAPTQYCLYLKAVKAGDPKMCDGIVLYRWSELCRKELAKP